MPIGSTKTPTATPLAGVALALLLTAASGQLSEAAHQAADGAVTVVALIDHRDNSASRSEITTSPVQSPTAVDRTARTTPQPADIARLDVAAFAVVTAQIGLTIANWVDNWD